jgi:hypothetical protein
VSCKICLLPKTFFDRSLCQVKPLVEGITRIRLALGLLCYVM